ncbi:MAG: biotin/lipoyl-containing protein [Acidimicrobiia bacterium]
MEALLSHGEGLGVPERMIIAPSVGVFRPHEDVDAVTVEEGTLVGEGQTVGHLDGPGTSTPVRSPFAGRLIGMLVAPGERLRQGQPVAWLRVV